MEEVLFATNSVLQNLQFLTVLIISLLKNECKEICTPERTNHTVLSRAHLTTLAHTLIMIFVLKEYKYF